MPLSLLYMVSLVFCEIHLHLYDNLKCPCVFIKLLLDHLQMSKPETFQHLPSHIQAKIKVKKDFMASLFYPAFNTQNGMLVIESQ